jgi:hypothetical protein
MCVSFSKMQEALLRDRQAYEEDRMIQTDISDETMNAEKNILVDAHWISL